ncbi:MAG: hypothetical protein M1821_003926 [Bathelium mastoideum]|nr:MAG: hypothetical protein M1821_003926 [Bathelium mastoideum]
MDEEQLVQLLESLLQPDTERVKLATATLNKDFYTSPNALAYLIRILTSDRKDEVKQLAAVECRKLVYKHWAAVPAEQKPQIRNHLLESTFKEDSTYIRHSYARVVSAIAQLDLQDGEWTDLPRVLQGAATSEAARQREVAIYILFTLLEVATDMFADNASDMLTLFARTIQDPESVEVRINTMLAISQLSLGIDTDEDPKSLQLLQQAVPSMVAVLKKSVEDGDEDHAMQAFEVFQTLVAGNPALLNPHFRDLVSFMLELSTNTEISEDSRVQSLSFLMQCVKLRRLKVQGLRLGEEITIRALQIVPELGDLTGDEEDLTPARSALGLLDILASSLPPSQVVVPLLKAIGPYVSSQEPDKRRAGILALGMCVEGAPDFVSTQLKEILPMVLHLLNDEDAMVRSAALNGVARLADDLAEDMGKEHARLLPALIQNFDVAMSQLQGPGGKTNLDIVRQSCNAVDSLIEGLAKEDAAKYVPELVPRISRLFEHEEFKVKAAAIGAVGAIAGASEEAFLPYYEQTMAALGKNVNIKDSQEDLDLRAITCDSIGKIAAAVGARPFQPYVQGLLVASEEALNLDHPRLKETSYILWSTVAKVYGEDFEPYLPGVVKGLIESLKQEEDELDVELGAEAQDLLGTEVTIAGKKVRVTAAGDEDADEDINGNDDDDWDDLETATAVAMEKEIAVEVIGDVLTSTKSKFLPFLESTIETVLPLMEHSYEGVRKTSITTLWRAYTMLWELAEQSGMEKWKPGLPLQVQPTTDLTKLGTLAMTGTLAVWQDEEDRGTVTDINRSLATTLKLCGPAILMNGNETVVAQIKNQVYAVLTKVHPCQQDPGVEDDTADALEESSEYDWLVIETAMEVVTCLAAALGESFAQGWKEFEKSILKYASSQDSTERSCAVGTIAECIGNMGSAVTPHTVGLMKVLMHRMGDEDPETKSNAVYGIGLLCEKSENDKEILSNYGLILGKLEPLLHGSQAARLLDNSAGCVSRMISKHKDNVPLQEVLPGLLDLLPLREDFEENEPIFKMIVQLCKIPHSYNLLNVRLTESIDQSGDVTMRQLSPQLMSVLPKVLGPPQEQLDDETRQRVLELAKFLQSQAG